MIGFNKDYFMADDHSHFTGKKPLEHVAEKLAQGKIDSAEAHGTEMPGFLAAGTDAARETAVLLLITSTIFFSLKLPSFKLFITLLIFSTGWAIWKFGRSAWLGWSRLERLHRVVRQEKWEIDNNRSQEKYELKELYAAKGFEGKLLDDVVDVLMADGDRLLRVMVEEELGLTLESHDHPLKQALGALWGVLITTGIILLFHWINPHYGLIIGALTGIIGSSALSANYEQNKIIPAIIWNVGLAVVAYAWVYFLYEFFLKVVSA
jgi:vacuolar iron transporter family protein